MLGVTADTNIYISALNFGGNPREFLRLAGAGGFRLSISDPILEEIGRVLRDEKFRWPQEEIEKAQARILRIAHREMPDREIDAIKVDPQDNRILECAVAGKSNYLVTGDNHLLRLGKIEDIPIVKVTEFLKVVRGEKRER